MADDKFRRRRRRVGEYGAPSQQRPREEISPTPRKPPITILGLARPSKVATPVGSGEPESSGATGGDPKLPDENTSGAPQNLQTSSSIHDSPSPGGHDKPTAVLLSDNRTRAVNVMPRPNDPDSSEVSSSQVASHSGGSNCNTEESASSSTTAATVRRTTSTPGAIISSVIDQTSQMQLKLAPPLEKQARIKLVDDHYQWCDNGLDLMLEQTDFLVVGAVGLQGCGKSTILSLLAGNSHHDAYRNYLFFPQTKETKEDCLFQTSGIDMFVTADRIILLDTEPLLSASMMDCLLRYERKFPPEYTSLQNFIEMQSLQLLTFLLSVCNVVLIADDWFVDLQLLRLVLDAEMLKPSTQPSPSSTESKDYDLELFPTVVFVHNKASREDFSPSSYFSMQHVLHEAFSGSKLKVRTCLNMTNNWDGEPMIHRLPKSSGSPAADVNLLLLPTMEFYKLEPEALDQCLPEYRGYPSFNSVLSYFRSQILSAPRSPITHSTLSEKNWYHFAARMWDSVKKSPLLMEYNRLLSTTS